MTRRSKEIKKLLEACLILLDAANAQATPEADRIPVTPEQIIFDWYSDAKVNGLMHKVQMEHKISPVIMGHPIRQKALFRQALTLVYLRSKYETPQITIYNFTKPNGMSEFTISDTSEQAELRLKPQAETESTEWKLCFAALSQTVTQEGGKLYGFTDKTSENAVVFDLISAPVDMQIDLQENTFAA